MPNPILMKQYRIFIPMENNLVDFSSFSNDVLTLHKLNKVLVPDILKQAFEQKESILSTLIANYMDSHCYKLTP